MKVHISNDYLSPVYDYNVVGFGLECDVDSETIARWRTSLDEWDKVQDEMQQVHDAALRNAAPRKPGAMLDEKLAALRAVHELDCAELAAVIEGEKP